MKLKTFFKFLDIREGRFNRLQCLGVFLLTTIIALLLVFLMQAIHFPFQMVLYKVIALIGIYIVALAFARRHRDLNTSGLWAILTLGYYSFSALYESYLDQRLPENFFAILDPIFGKVLMGIPLGALIEISGFLIILALLLIPGSKQENRFGEEPKGIVPKKAP